MFAKSITDSDDFLDLPLDVQLLYFHLGMQADDEGFLNSTRKIVRMLGVEPDALKILCDTGFLIPFPSGVVAIRHWHVNNKIRKDRYIGTQFVAEWEQLTQRYEVYEWAVPGEGCAETKVGEVGTKVGTLGTKVGEVGTKIGRAETKVGTLETKVGKVGAKEREGKDRAGEERVGKASEVERSEGEKSEEKQSIAQSSEGEETRFVASPAELCTNPQPPVASSVGEKEEKEFFDFEFQRKKEEALQRLRDYQFQPLPSEETREEGALV